MSNVLHLTVDNPDEILNASYGGTGAVIQIQSATSQGGTYTDLVTVAIVTATYSYTAYDTSGDSTTWYRTRYETSGGVAVSDWSDEFQAGGPTGGLICSLQDAKQRIGGSVLTGTTEDENLLDFIRDVTTFVEGKCRRWFVSRASATYLLSPDCMTRILWFPKGVQSVSALGYATTDQPDTGGTYTSIAATSYSLWPPELDRRPGWPATGLRLLNNSAYYFYPGVNTVQITLVGGWSAVPDDIQGVALNLVVSKYRERASGGGDRVTVGFDGERTYERLLSTTDWSVLKRYTDPVP